MSAFKSGDFIHPLDKIARQQLEGIPLLQPAVRQYLKVMGEKQWRAMLLANAIRLGPRQVPEVYRYLPPICEKFGIDEPELFIMRGDSNAFTVGHTKTVIVLYDQLLEDLNDDEIRAVIAHECGHIVCEHILYRQMTHALIGTTNALSMFTGPVGGLAKVASAPLQMAIMTWYRKSELSADRAAAVYLASPDPLQRALFHMTGVPKWFTGTVSYPDFVAQTQEFDMLAEQGKWGAILTRRIDNASTHPNPAIRFRELTSWAETREYHALLEVSGKDSAAGRAKCSNCGHNMEAGWSFCQRCGSASDSPGNL